MMYTALQPVSIVAGPTQAIDDSFAQGSRALLYRLQGRFELSRALVKR